MVCLNTEIQPKEETPMQENREKIDELMKQFDLSHETYKKVSTILNQEMDKGLSSKGHAAAAIKMFPTYVRALPDGTEKGDILALDLGGTNFRVLLISLNGKEVKMENKIYPIAESIMVGPGEKLFDYIAECIASFLKTHNLLHKTLPLGFTFSFPCKQEGLAVGRLVTWTKGFKCSGVEGENVVQLLQEAIKRRGDLHVDCVAILNDTVGCLMSCAFSDHNCEIGVILGTGTNACYMEKLDKVDLWDEDKNEPRQVIINTEWGAFGDDKTIDFIRTEADFDIDRNSINPGKQTFEKLISGMYMGEIARQMLVTCAKKNVLFNGVVTEDLAERGRFYTKYISEIAKDKLGSLYENTQLVLGELGYEKVSLNDCEAVHIVCELVARRAANLASAGIATLLNRIDKPSVTVAVDGSLYRYHPDFHNLMMKKIGELINPGLKFSMMLSEDGSGKGAALVAAVAARMQQE